MAAAADALLPPAPDSSGRRARNAAVRLELATVGWNLLEVGFAITAGIAAQSLGLVAFGLDSLVEVFASLVVIGHTRGMSGAHVRHPRRALRLIAASFSILGISLMGSAVLALVAGHRPSQSLPGIGFMAVTALVMFGLAGAKLKLGRRFGNEPLVANAGLTMLDGYVAAGVCAALVADLALGWWWCDAVIAGAVGLIAVREGVSRWRGAGPVASARENPDLVG